MDLPVDGRRPGEAQRAVLNQYAEQAGRAVVVALEREALAEQVRMAEAARRIVRSASAQLSLERIVADSQEALVEGFRAAGHVDPDVRPRTASGTGTIYSADGTEVELAARARRDRRGGRARGLGAASRSRSSPRTVPFGPTDHRRAGRR